MNDKKLTGSDAVYALLEYVQLEKFWPKIRDDLQISRLTHFDYVKQKDLERIGISKPAIRRLFDALKKIQQQKDSSGVQYRKRAKSIDYTSSYTSASGAAAAPLTTNGNSSQSFLINENDLEISDTILGTGNFGIVKKAIWKVPSGAKVPVAVKILQKSVFSQSQNDGILGEISHMCTLKHKCIVRLFGLAISTNNNEQLLMVTELAPLGSLLDYLQNNAFKILIGLLHTYIYQVASGMEYLESRKLIHRDLAARNILLFSCDQVKICDFGMMKRLNGNKNSYNFDESQKVPFLWYPPESLRFRTFSLKSDVWMMGVTIWEIFSFGERPWGSNLDPAKLLQVLENGQRLKKPELCSNRLYSVVSRCWMANENDRPSFQVLTRQIREAWPAEMKAKQSFSETNRLTVEQGDTVTIIDGVASKYWWKGQNNRTIKYGYFPRSILDPQRPINSSDISLPLKNSFIHTGHMSATAKEIWGYPDKIDEIFLKNPLNPPDLLNTELVHEEKPIPNPKSKRSSAEPTAKHNKPDKLIDIDENSHNSTTTVTPSTQPMSSTPPHPPYLYVNDIMSRRNDNNFNPPYNPVITNRLPEYQPKPPYEATNNQINNSHIYQNSDTNSSYKTNNEQKVYRESNNPFQPTTVIKTSNSNSMPRSNSNSSLPTMIIPTNDIKNGAHTTKSSTAQKISPKVFESKMKNASNVDFDQFFNKVMNDVMNDLSKKPMNANTMNHQVTPKTNYYAPTHNTFNNGTLNGSNTSHTIIQSNQRITYF